MNTYTQFGLLLFVLQHDNTISDQNLFTFVSLFSVLETDCVPFMYEVRSKQ